MCKIFFLKNRHNNQVNDNTPIYNSIVKEATLLDQKSSYKSDFNYNVYKQLEERFLNSEVPRGGIIFNAAIKVSNEGKLYIDAYGRGCSHDCLDCPSKSDLVVHGYWNKPFPMPIDINGIRKIFYTVFETNEPSRYRTIMQNRDIPINIGYSSDSFIWMDAKYKVTQEILKILNHYRYPYNIKTKSDLIAHDTYIELLNKDLARIGMSILTTNEDVARKIEVGAPSTKRRLNTAKKLQDAGYKVTIILKNVYPTFSRISDISEDIKVIAAIGLKNIKVNFKPISSYSLNQLDKSLGLDMRTFYNGKDFDRTRAYKLSEVDINYIKSKLHNVSRSLEGVCISY